MKAGLALALVSVALFVGCQADNGAHPVSELDHNTHTDTWVAIEPTQCLTNDWEKEWLERNGQDYAGYPKDPATPGLEPEELKVIQDYYSRQGVVVFDSATASKYETVCLACSCPEGHTMYLLVRGEDVEVMIGFGYRVESPRPSN